jgi:hypothetical protein
MILENSMTSFDVGDGDPECLNDLGASVDTKSMVMLRIVCAEEISVYHD